MANISNVGEGKVVLIAGGGKIYSEVAARFCRSEKGMEDIIAEPYVKEILSSIIESNHKAALEFDDFIFGIEGFARVTELQLVRKRMASYMIKSGRPNKGGRRSYDVVLPNTIQDFNIYHTTQADSIFLEADTGDIVPLSSIIKNSVCVNGFHLSPSTEYMVRYNAMDLIEILEHWYNSGVNHGIAEEDLRYMKPQGTEIKAVIKMNASALGDWFQIRLCRRAQTEIRDLAKKIYALCYKACPDIFSHYGPSCHVLGYCPEREQCKEFRGVIPTKKEALQILQEHYHM